MLRTQVVMLLPSMLSQQQKLGLAGIQLLPTSIAKAAHNSQECRNVCRRLQIHLSAICKLWWWWWLVVYTGGPSLRTAALHCCLFSSADLLSTADRSARWVSSLLRPHHPTTTATYPAALLLPSKYPVCRTVRVGPSSRSSMVAQTGAECPSIEHPSRWPCCHTAAASRTY